MLKLRVEEGAPILVIESGTHQIELRPGNELTLRVGQSAVSIRFEGHKVIVDPAVESSMEVCILGISSDELRAGDSQSEAVLRSSSAASFIENYCRPRWHEGNCPF